MFDKTKKQWFNNIKKQVIEIPFSKAMLYILITFGLVLLVMFLFSLENKNHLAPLAILLASQIAGFSIIYTINNTNRLEQKKQEDEKVKTQKVLSSYFKHLIVLAKEQKKYFNELEIRIHKSPNTHLKDLMIIETSFEDDLNTIAFINPIESMLNPDLHKYSNEEMLNLILTIKTKVLEMIHIMKIIKNTLVKNNSRNEILDLVSHMKSDINIIINDSEKYIS